ncbi:MAG: hypothetical protein H5T63_08050, partial [Chloroflexi bacterium]|nr:hypothetical protein [Chloroflexota bacterium]
GAWYCGRLLRIRVLSSLALATIMLLPALLFWRNYPSFWQLSQDRSVREYAEGLLATAPQGARILSNWHYATPLWYLQYVEQARPDVEVFYVYPEGAEPIAQTWLRRLNESVAQRPTVVTNYYPEFQTTPYTFQPLAGAFLVQSAPAYQMPDEMQPIQVRFDERIELMGYRLEEDIVSPADTLVVQVCWRPVIKLERDYSFFVHLVDGNGAVVGQGDITHPAARYEVGQVILDGYRIPLLPTIQPGRYQVIGGVYITLAEGGWRRLMTAEGSDHLKFTTVEVLPLQIPPVTLHGLYRPFMCGYTLLGVDYDRSLPDQLRVYLHWRADSQVSEGWQVVMFFGENRLSTASLPIVPEGKYFTTVHDLPAGGTNLAFEVHNATGVPSAWLGPWKVPLAFRIRLPAAPGDARYIPLGGEMILVGADYPRTSSDGQLLRTRLTFLAAKPITHDYSVSVSIVGEDSSWRAQHDGTPALGAIPTLKWIRGMTVWDEHDLSLPPLAAGRGVLYLTVYDAFTMRTLPVLDERLARLGQGTRIALGTVEVRR